MDKSFCIRIKHSNEYVRVSDSTRGRMYIVDKSDAVIPGTVTYRLRDMAMLLSPQLFLHHCNHGKSPLDFWETTTDPTEPLSTRAPMFANEDLSPPTVCDAPDTPDSPIVPKSRRKPRRFGATTTIPSDGSDDSNRRRGKTTTYRRKVILDDDVDQIPPQLKSSKSKRVLSRPKSKQVATLEAPIHRPPVASPPTSNQSKSEVECVDETDLVEAVVNDEDWKGQRLDALDGPMWTESVVHAFFRRPFRQSGQFGLDPDLVLIKSFKRYGSGARFKFKCAFRHPRTRLCVVQWARYQDLLPNPTYMAKLKSYGFEISVTSKLDCGLKDMKGEEDWSDGVEADEDGTIDFSLDVNTSSQPKRKSRRKFPEFAIGALDEMLNAATSGPDDHLDSDDAVPAIEVADKDL